jgi:hypothetical protein
MESFKEQSRSYTSQLTLSQILFPPKKKKIGWRVHEIMNSKSTCSLSLQKVGHTQDT